MQALLEPVLEHPDSPHGMQYIPSNYTRDIYGWQSGVRRSTNVDRAAIWDFNDDSTLARLYQPVLTYPP